ncbi:MAG: NIPSNAP family protein [Akkermansiaceae bacterium]|nr:NIPSNAP family protein [Akkermansiaceae bacterium]
MKNALVFTAFAALLAVFVPAARSADPDSRVFELRLYHAAPGKLDALQARFRDHTVRLFEKHGMTNVGYWIPAENPDNLLVYLMAYPSRDAREAMWKAFFADPDWQAAKEASEKDGKLVEKVDASFLALTDYSPARVRPSRAQQFELRTYTATGRLRLDAFAAHHQLFKRHGLANVACCHPGRPARRSQHAGFLSLRTCAGRVQSLRRVRTGRRPAKASGKTVPAHQGRVNSRYRPPFRPEMARRIHNGTFPASPFSRPSGHRRSARLSAPARKRSETHRKIAATDLPG